MSTAAAPGHQPSSYRPPKHWLLRPVNRLLPGLVLVAATTVFRLEKTLPNTQLAIQPVAQDKLVQPGPLEGATAQNNRLFSSSARKIFDGVLGSESISFDPDGTQYGSDDAGMVWRVAPGSSKHEPIAFMGGRPLGHQMDANGNLVMADAAKGLVSLNVETGERKLLTNHVDDIKSFNNRSEIQYANDLDIASDGTIYFSDSGVVPSLRNAAGKIDTMGGFMRTYFHGGATGRLLKYTPATGKTELLAEGFYYANGVAVGEDETYVLVVETAALSVWKVWVKGPKAGQKEIFATELPGMPDGVSRAPDGSYWVAIVARPPSFFYALRSYPVLRWISAWTPPALLPTPKPYGLVLQLSKEGKVLQSLHDPTGTHIWAVSSVHEHDGALYLGSLQAPHMLKVSK